MPKQFTSQQFKLTLKEIVLWLLQQRQRFVVAGHSMQPLLQDNDIVLTKKIRSILEIQVGDIVVAKHPHKDTLVVKQVREVDTHQQRVFLQGINEHEHHDTGWVSYTLLHGKVTAIFV